MVLRGCAVWKQVIKAIKEVERTHPSEVREIVADKILRIAGDQPFRVSLEMGARENGKQTKHQGSRVELKSGKPVRVIFDKRLQGA